MTTLTYWAMSKADASGAPESIPDDFAGDSPPKLSFRFTVEIKYRSNLSDQGDKEMSFCRFALKSATRPSISINNEDVNYYGYRAKVATRVNYGNASITFYEDPENLADNLFWNYLKYISSHAGVGKQAHNTSGEELPFPETQTIKEWANTDGPIERITVYQHYTKNGDPAYTAHHYLNPKLESVEFSHLDMSVSEATMVTITFAPENITEENG